MPRKSRTNIRRAWKLERASVHKKRKRRPRSNKYSSTDKEAIPKPHKRKQVWVGGYKRRGGKKIAGYFRRNSQHA